MFKVGDRVRQVVGAKAGRLGNVIRVSRPGPSALYTVQWDGIKSPDPCRLDEQIEQKLYRIPIMFVPERRVYEELKRRADKGKITISTYMERVLKEVLSLR